MTYRAVRAGLVLLVGIAAVGVGASCASTADRSATRSGPVKEKLPRLADVFETFGEDELAYFDHVVTLSNLYFEGRSADTEGAARAAEYLSYHFTRIGLEPAFEVEGEGTLAMGGANTMSMSFEQTFDVPGELEVVESAAVVTTHRGEEELQEGEDYSVMGFTGNAEFEGPLVFVGYSIAEGPDGYTSYAEDDDLEGKIAVMLRFEPMDPDGTSKWSTGGRWSSRASFAGKVRAAAERGASGIIIINPPGADDPRARRLASTNATRFDADLEIPAVMLSTKAADELLQAADPAGRGLMEFRRAADEGEIDRAVDLVAHGVEVALRAEVVRKRYEAANVGAILEGKGSLKDEWVVVGGHYDHLGYGRLGGTRAGDRVGEVHRGADDNASGAAGVLLIAEQMKRAYDEMDDSEDARSVLFLQFGAEEMGLLGSKHYVENTSLAASSVNAMLNLDMIGRIKNNTVEVYGTGTAEQMREKLAPHFEKSGFKVTEHEAGVGPSDHASFYRAGIPALHFFSGLHAEYHTPDDVPWLVNYRDAVRMTEFITGIALDFATERDRLAHVPAPASTGTGNRMSNMKVRLGIAPGSYGEEGKGVMVGEVFPGTSADEGGIQAGDVIINWNGEEVPGVMAMMEQLLSHEPGDVARIVVNRDGEEVTLLVKLQARGGEG